MTAMMKPIRWATLGLLACAIAATPSHAQSPDQNADPLQSLDELLGLEETSADTEPGTDADTPPAGDVIREELDRELDPNAKPGDRFREAVDLMGRTAERLEGPADAGAATQRLQEDIIRKLDTVIEAARNNQQQQSSSSSSQNNQNQQQQSAQQQGTQSTPQQAQGTTDDPQAVDAPSSTDTVLAPQQPASAAAWGRLPERTRDALSQGLQDRYSSLYERLTETYYRRLAEEAR